MGRRLTMKERTLLMGMALTMEEKALLKQQGYDHKYFLRLSKTANNFEFIEVHTGKILNVRR